MSPLLNQLLMFLSGFIDSIAGGGGLIALPTITLIEGAGATAIGTNKIIALATAAIALANYARKGHLRLQGSLPFLLGIIAGTLIGAGTARYFLSPNLFRILLMVICPVILAITLMPKSKLAHEGELHVAKPPLIIAALGLLCGFYDGVFGPGAGTFMFLSLVYFGGFALLEAMATSKLANSCSAAFGLTSYALQKQVDWGTGLKLMGFGIVGALIGSQLANQRARLVVRPILIVIVVLLLIKIVL